jgi:GTP-binding protein
VALKIEDPMAKDSFYVSGRGELQLAVLIETMRREGFELAVSRPRVVMHKDESGQLMEPIEEVVIDVDEEHSGVVVQKMSERKAEMPNCARPAAGAPRLVFPCADARTDRLPVGAADRHARHRRDEPSVP